MEFLWDSGISKLFFKVSIDVDGFFIAFSETVLVGASSKLRPRIFKPKII